MSDNVKKYKIFILSSLFASACMAVVRLFLVMDNIEMESLGTNGLYYLEGSNAPTVFAVFCAVLALLFLAGALIFAGKIKSFPQKDNPSVNFASALSGMMLLTVVIYFAYLFVLEKRAFTGWFIAVLLFSVVAAAYFLCISSRRAYKRAPKLIAVLSVAPIFLTAVRLLNDFILHSLTVTASSYVYHLMGLVSLLMFLCCEGKSTVGYRRKKTYVFWGLTACMLLLVYCVPALYLSLFWPIKFTDETVFCIVDVVMAAYIACRLISLPASAEEDAAVPAEE